MNNSGLFELEKFLESSSTSSTLDDIMKLNVFGESAEAPSTKPYDAASIPVPKGTTITADAYNSALAALKKSFKEGVEIITMLENVNVEKK